MTTTFLSLLKRAMAPGAGPTEFAALFAAVLAGLLFTAAASATFLEWANRRNGANRIQKDRPQASFASQIRRIPGSILTITLAFSFALFAQWQGWAPTPVRLSWWSVPLFLALSIVLYDIWFFAVHRLLHTRPMYRFHLPHHRSVTPTYFDNHNETLVEAGLNQLYFALVLFVVPIPWQVLVLHKIYDQFSGMMGHNGFEHFASPAGRAPWPLASAVFHDQHHRYFHYNFAHSFSILDRVFGTTHPNYDQTVRDFERNVLNLQKKD